MTAFRVVVTGARLAVPARSILEEAGAELAFMTGSVDPDALGHVLAERPTEAILMRGNPSIGPELMDAAPALRVIAKHGAGVDSVDLAAAAQRGITVTIAGDANAPAVAEHTIALILALGRDIPSLNDRTRRGHWDRDGYAGRELAGRCLGVVGWGRIGRLVARTASCLGLQIIALPRRPGSVDPALAREAPDLATLLAEADIVSLHVPLTSQTRGMIGPSELAAMRQGALLINTARGALVDEAAVAAAVRDGHLGGAAFDVLGQEPPDASHPLLTTPGIVVTPHIASATDASLTRMGVAAARNIVAVITGRELDPGNVVS